MADPLFTVTGISKGGRAGGHVALAQGGVYLHMEHDKGLGGSGEGSNPEQLFAMGWATCFNGAVLLVASQKKIDAAKAIVKCEVGLVRGDGLSLQAKLTISVPGLDRAQAQELIEAAHQVCPYSKATRNNIPVELAVE
jgi:osmotically inducible protein OsmC